MGGDENEWRQRNAAFDIKSSLPKNGLVTQHHSYEFLLSYYNFKNIQQHCSSSHLFYISFFLPSLHPHPLSFSLNNEKIVYRAFSRLLFCWWKFIRKVHRQFVRLSRNTSFNCQFEEAHSNHLSLSLSVALLCYYIVSFSWHMEFNLTFNIQQITCQ